MPLRLCENQKEKKGHLTETQRHGGVVRMLLGLARAPDHSVD